MAWKLLPQILCLVCWLSQPVLGRQPWIRMEGYAESGIKLTCESEGWNSKPEVSWVDGNERTMTSQTESFSSADGSFKVQTSLIVTKDSSNKFKCLFTDSTSKTKTEGRVQIAESFFPSVSLPLVFSLLFFFIFLVGIGVVSFFIWKQFKKTTGLNKELEAIQLNPMEPSKETPLLKSDA